MRPTPEWAILADDRILEYLDENGAASPQIIKDAIRDRWGAEHIGNRLRDHLTPHELTERVGRGVYRITDRGRAYLAGDLDAEELEE